MPIRFSAFRLPVAALCLALGACTPPPVFKPAAAPVDAAPQAVAREPGRFADAPVVWGGRIVEVRNRADASEIVILAYPLDAGQRPRPGDNSQGRFIAVLRGYVESLDYPAGRFVSVIGHLAGTRVEPVHAHDYVYPQVVVDGVHLWPVGFEHDRPQVHFGIGIRGAIR